MPKHNDQTLKIKETEKNWKAVRQMIPHLYGKTIRMTADFF